MMVCARRVAAAFASARDIADEADGDEDEDDDNNAAAGVDEASIGGGMSGVASTRDVDEYCGIRFTSLA